MMMTAYAFKIINLRDESNLCDYDVDSEIFSINFENKWSISLKNTGVEPSKMSSNFGSA